MCPLLVNMKTQGIKKQIEVGTSPIKNRITFVFVKNLLLTAAVFQYGRHLYFIAAISN